MILKTIFHFKADSMEPCLSKEFKIIPISNTSVSRPYVGWIRQLQDKITTNVYNCQMCGD